MPTPESGLPFTTAGGVDDITAQVRVDRAEAPEELAQLVADSAAMAGSFKPFGLGGNRVVFCGDSITAANTPNTGAYPLNLATYGALLSKGNLVYTANVAVSGRTSADVLANFDTEVTPLSPGVVHVLVGTNDSNDASPVSVASFATNIKAIAAKCNLIGATPVFGTLPPSNVSSGRRQLIAKYNAWLRRWCSDNAVLLVDYHTLLVDPANGQFLSGYYLDGTHPNNTGQAAMGALMASTLSGKLAQAGVHLPPTNVDGASLVANGLFLGSLTSGVPSSWTASPATLPGTVVASQVTNDTAIKGNWYRWTMSALNGTQTLFQTVSGITPGDRYAFVGRTKATGLTAATVMARILFNGSTATGYQFRAMSTLAGDISDGVFYIEGVAPNDATTCQVNLQLAGSSGSSAAVWDIAQVALYDLTALGVLANL